jgi:L-iditol 2-dehydrogenase
MCKTFKTSNLDPGGFAELVRIPASHVEMTAFRIPDGMSYERAIHMEPLGCVIRNLKRTNLQPGDTVLVIGLGSIGLLTGQMVRRIPCRVIATDLREDRRSIARILGFEKVLHGNDPNLGTEIRQATDGRGADLVVLTAGTPALYEEAAHWVREGGSVNIFAGLEPGARVSYDLEELYHREITIFSSYSASPQDLGEALQHLAAGTVNVEIFSSEPFGLKNVSEAVQAVVEQRILKAIIRPEGISL